MKKIILNKIILDKGLLTYDFSYSDELSKFFSGNPFWIKYPETLMNIPLSILTVPFVCNILPIIWMTGAVLEIEEIDKSFYDCIPKLLNGYIKMYPTVCFGGEIRAKKIVENQYSNSNKSAMFYSGGLDSASTLVSHLDESPILLSVWGSDIRYNNIEGWNLVHSAIQETADKFSLQEYVFRSTFRDFDKENVLDKEFSNKLGDGWWHGIKHSLALLGHIAPFVYKHKISKMYIASTLCEDYGFATCASVPYVDNQFRVSSCSVLHDGYKYSRQQKAQNISNYFKGDLFKLHVCWVTQTGDNCCLCEKCYRTMANFWAEGDSFSQYGFNCDIGRLKSMPECISNLSPEAKMQMYWWKDIQKRAVENINALKKKPNYKFFKWIINADFDHPESIKMPFSYRVRKKLSAFRLYRMFVPRIKKLITK